MVILDRFGYFLYHWKQEWILYKANRNFVTSTCLQATWWTKSTIKTSERSLQCVMLNRVFQTFAKSHSVFISFPVCYKIPLTVFWQKMGFIKTLSLNLMWLILTCKVKLSCRDLWRVTVITSSSYWVSKLHEIMECSFLFPEVQEL